MVQATRGERVFNRFNYVLLSVIAAACVFPFVNTIAVSFSSNTAVISGRVSVVPVDFTIDTYRTVFTGSDIMRALKNTVVVTAIGSAINLTLTILSAYPLSKARLRGRGAILIAIAFTMMFNAGLIPNYLLVRNLGLVNTYWAVWLPLAISPFNMIVLKTFFQALPDSLEESAMMDGCNDFVIMTRITLPLSMAALATILLFYAVGHWNGYFNVLIYITDSTKLTLQVRLRQLLLDSSVMAAMQNIIQDTADIDRVAEESLKAASIVVATVPILLVYPFLQKYFVKGVMIGSLKG